MLQLLKVVMAQESRVFVKIFNQINHYRADPSGWIGSVIMLVFAFIAGYRWHTSGYIFFCLLVIRDLAASWFLISRKQTADKFDTRFNYVLAYVSSALPVIYLESWKPLPHAGLVSSLLAIAGFTISTLALFDLGSSFGVSPANRGLVDTGFYRYVRHPMYFGYVLSEFGFIILNPINVIIWITSVSLYYGRSKIEDRVLKVTS